MYFANFEGDMTTGFEHATQFVKDLKITSR